MRRWYWRSGVSLVAVAMLGLAAVGAATSSVAAVKPAKSMSWLKVLNYDGDCIDVANGSPSGKVQQWPCNKNQWQYWAIYPSNSGIPYAGDLIQNYWNGQCLAADGDSPGSPVIQRNCDPNSHAQNWILNSAKSGNFQYYISAQLSGGCSIVSETECGIHPSGGSTQAGAGLYIQFPNSQNGLHSFWWEPGPLL